MWLPPALLLLSLLGCFSIQGPKVARGLEGGSLTVECRYKPGWETNRKWWCRGANWYHCQTLIQTTSSQRTVQGPRLSISDNQRDRVISVTMSSLQRDDQDTYWCGIRRLGTDRGTRIQVIVVGPENWLSWMTTNSTGVSSGSLVRNHYLLLVFVKVPLLLAVVGAVLWLKGPQRVPEEQWEQPVHTNLAYDLAGDAAPWTDGGETLGALDSVSRGDPGWESHSCKGPPVPCPAQPGTGLRPPCLGSAAGGTHLFPLLRVAHSPAQPTQPSRVR